MNGHLAYKPNLVKFFNPDEFVYLQARFMTKLVLNSQFK